jgi:hypothetical protein
MSHEQSIARYRNVYAKLVRLHSKPFYERFGEGMEQTFCDLLQERAEKEGGLLVFVLWIFAETSAGIIREKFTLLTKQNKNIIRLALATAFLLPVPLIAMQVTDEVRWSPFAFVVAGTLLFGTGLTYELAARRMGSIVYRAAVGVAVAAALLLVWINLAVGIIGDEGNPANLMYIGVLAVGIIGAVIARLRPQGMARALLATALAQMLVAVIAKVTGMESMFILNGCFAALWVGSALLFRRASVTGAK